MKPRLALPLAVVVFVAVTAGAFFLALRGTGGRWVYPLDDSYILLAMASNLADHGVWGVQGREFASCSSTPLYLIATAAVARLTSVREWIPLATNFTFAILLLWAAWRLLRDFQPGFARATGALLALVLAMPLPLMALSGMEHVLHTLLAFLFLYAVLDDSAGARSIAPAVFAALMVGVRFESMALVGLGAIALWMKERRTAAFLAGAAATLPVILYGWMNVQHGWPFLPASMVVKVNPPRPLDLLGWRALSQLQSAPVLFALMAAVAVLFLAHSRKGWRGTREQYLLALTGSLILAHLNFANVGWLMRYEAYLVAIGIVAVAAAWPWTWADVVRNRTFALGALVLAASLASPLAYRARHGFLYAVHCPRNIHDQQLQMARFIERYYNSAVVGLNDIGAPAYFTRARLVDYTGLANLEALHMRTRGQLFWLNRPDDVARLFRNTGVQVAMLYENWLTGPLPGWVRAGSWDTFNYADALGGSRVSFFAPGEEEATRLASQLLEFKNSAATVAAQ